VFTKYVVRPVAADEDDEGDDEAPLLEGKAAPPESCTAWLRRRPMSTWERLLYFMRWYTPEEGDLWIRMEVKPLTKNYGVDDGEVRSRPVNVVDCHAETASFVNPFIRLYQVRPSPVSLKGHHPCMVDDACGPCRGRLTAPVGKSSISMTKWLWWGACGYAGQLLLLAVVRHAAAAGDDVAGGGGEDRRA
jgi:hypothetical protein